MRLAISNIAWDVSEDERVAHLLGQYRVDAIDVAPGKYFPVPAEASDLEIARVRRWWAERGIEITGMQSLLFGTTGLNLFGVEAVQEAMLKHLASICRIGEGLGATRLVFGSPRNRDRTGLTDYETEVQAAAFFRRLGDIAASHGVIICLEPNPACYGSNFMMTSLETAEIVRRIAHPAIMMQLDSGALAINGEDVETVLKGCAQLIGHVHASEPQLKTLGEGGVDHRHVCEALERHLPDHVVSIEMLTPEGAHELSIRCALEVATQAYRQGGGAEQ